MQADIAFGQMLGSRESQQDYVKCLSWPDGLQLLVLADGMGGTAGGAVASEQVVETLVDAFAGASHLAIRERLLRALQEANDAVYYTIQSSPELAGMGTTLIAVTIQEELMHWVSVGDSPLWLCRMRRIRRMNENHSIGGLLDRQVEAGELSVEEAVSDPRRSNLLEAVLGETIELVDAPRAPVRIGLGDVVILASDGVETCSADEVCEIASYGHSSSSGLVDAILEAVKDHARQGQDNATLIVVRLDSDEASDPA